MFDTKIKIALRKDLPTWQALNVTAFLMSGITASDKITGEAYRTKDGHVFLPMSRQPIMVHEGDGDELLAVLRKAETKDCVISIFTEELFNTFNDEDNRAAVAAVNFDDLHLVGIGVRGKKSHVDKLFKDLPLHK